MTAANLVSTADSPPGHVVTMPTHSRPVTSMYSSHSGFWAHVRLGVIQAKGLHLDGSMARFWLQFREFLEDESFGATKVINDSSFHLGRFKSLFDAKKNRGQIIR